MKRIAIDTECTGVNSWTGSRPFAVSMCDEDGETKWFEWTVDPQTRMPRVRLGDLKEIKAICADPGIVKVFFNASFDITMLKAIGVRVRGRIDEVLWMAKACNNLEHTFELKPLSKKYAQFPDDDQTDLQQAVVRARRLAKKLGWNYAVDKTHGSKPVKADYWIPETLWRLEPEKAAEAEIPRGLCEAYGVTDAERTIVLDAFYREGMRKLGVEKTYEFEMSLWPTTFAMQHRGVVVDGGRMKTLITEVSARIVHLKDSLREITGNAEFNHNSPKQVGDLLFGPVSKGGLGLPVLGWTKTKMPKTGSEFLLPHKNHPVVAELVELRSKEKAITTFFGKYESLARQEKDGLVLHPGYEQWGTLTGRYTCRNPNLQQVSDPTTTQSRMAEHVIDVRQVFIPRKGHVWYAFDYSQVEVIIFACISQEPSLIQAIKDGIDIHDVTANKVWGGKGNRKAVDAAMELLETRKKNKAIDALDACGWVITALENSLGKKLFRKKAKAVTFTKIFGGGPKALMSWIGCGKGEAREILADYDRVFPAMAERMDEIEARGKRDGFIINSFGRRLAVDPWNAYRAVNHWVQSDAADLMKRGMLKCAQYLERVGAEAWILMTIHDELLFEFKKGENTRKRLRKLSALMSDNGGVYEVPTPVHAERITERWGQGKAILL